MTTKKIFAGIQCRLNSSRFPNKALAYILGKPLIVHVVNRIQKISYPMDICILCPKEDCDQIKKIIDQFSLNIPVFGGSSNNVLLRYIQALDFFPEYYDVIMRITGDNPLISIKLADQLITLHDPEKHDLSHFINNPHGTGIELISHDALKKSFEADLTEFEQEHMTQYIYKNPEQFHIFEPKALFRETYSNVSVDYPEDISKIENILLKNLDWDLDLF
ncbi:MAG: cytidylyltransferase domain-containing protein [Brevinemataceae bacterium]